MNRATEAHPNRMERKTMPIRLARVIPAAIARRIVYAAAIACLAAGPAFAANTIEVEHTLGTTTVPVGPKRVATFDLSVLDSIDAMGVPGLVLAMPKQIIPAYLAQYRDAAVVDAGGMREPNLERIHEFAPDVIFISARQTDYYDKLSAIAPTVCANVDYADFMNSFRRNMLMLGEVFGAGDAARELADAVADKARTVAEKAAKSGKKGLVVMVNDGNVSAYGPGSRFGLIHDVLGVPPADPGIKVSRHGQAVDFEYLAKTNPDILFVINRNIAIGTAANASKVLDNELVANTRAGKTGNIVNLDSAVWYLSGAGLESLDIMLDEVGGAFE